MAPPPKPVPGRGPDRAARPAIHATLPACPGPAPPHPGRTRPHLGSAVHRAQPPAPRPLGPFRPGDHPGRPLMTPPQEPPPSHASGRAAHPTQPSDHRNPAPATRPQTAPHHPGDAHRHARPSTPPPRRPEPPSLGDCTAERAVFVRYLQAVINVYAPWTTSRVISDRERRFARDRVAKAQDLLDRFSGRARHPPADEEPPKTHRPPH